MLKVCENVVLHHTLLELFLFMLLLTGAVEEHQFRIHKILGNQEDNNKTLLSDEKKIITLFHM